jgi:tetratricopeptide (TPR) repeat protein
LSHQADDPELLFLQAQLRMDRKDFAGAEQLLRQLLVTSERTHAAPGVSEGPQGWQVLDLLGQVCRMQGRPDEAQTLWRQVLVQRPQSTRTWLRLAELYASQQRWDALEQLARQLEVEHRQSADAALVRARSHMARNELEAARNLAQEAARLAPAALEAREMLSQVLLLEGKDLAAAEQALRDVLALDPGNATARQRLVAFLARTGRVRPTAAAPPAQPWAVVLVQPPQYPHSAVFLEVSRLLYESLRSLGHNVVQQTNQLAPEAFNIVLGYHLLSGTQWPAGRCIFYQLEQLPGSDPATLEQRLLALRQAVSVWDYSADNISMLHEKGLKSVQRLPLGYHEALRTIPATDKDIDVLFYGSVNERRQVVLEQLASQCKVQHLFGVYGEERDRWIARSRIVLNMHFYPAQIMEQVRISYLLNNGCFVLSEEAPHNPYEGCLATAPYTELVPRCLYYLSHPEERDRIAREGLARFARRPMVEYLRPVLESLQRQGS